MIEKAALSPKIHRDLWDRWRKGPPAEEARIHLVQNRGFQEKGAEAVLAEYQKTMAYVDAMSSNRNAQAARAILSNRPGQAPAHASRSGAADTGQGENFIDLRFEGNRLILSASIGREGIPHLVRMLRANQAFLGRNENTAKKTIKRGKRRR